MYIGESLFDYGFSNWGVVKLDGITRGKIRKYGCKTSPLFATSQRISTCLQNCLGWDVFWVYFFVEEKVYSCESQVFVFL